MKSGKLDSFSHPPVKKQAEKGSLSKLRGNLSIWIYAVLCFLKLQKENKRKKNSKKLILFPNILCGLGATCCMWGHHGRRHEWSNGCWHAALFIDLWTTVGRVANAPPAKGPNINQDSLGGVSGAPMLVAIDPASLSPILTTVHTAEIPKNSQRFCKFQTDEGFLTRIVKDYSRVPEVLTNNQSKSATLLRERDSFQDSFEDSLTFFGYRMAVNKWPGILRGILRVFSWNWLVNSQFKDYWHKDSSRFLRIILNNLRLCRALGSIFSCLQ